MITILFILSMLGHPHHPLPPIPERSVTLQATCTVSKCTPCPESPDERDIFPECIFIQAHRVITEDDYSPEKMDLRAFSILQRNLPGYNGVGIGTWCTYTITSRFTGQSQLVFNSADASLSVARWIRSYISPPPRTFKWHDFTKDYVTDLYDYRVFLDQWFTGASNNVEK